MEPSLSDLILFIDEETTLLNDALFSRDAVSQNQEKKEKYDQKKKVNTFLAKTEIQTNESFKLKAQKEEIECSVCGKSYAIEDCEDVMGVIEKSPECLMQKVAPTKMFIRCVMASTQQHYMDWF